MSSDSHFEHAVGLARDGIRSLFVFNVGAAGALIALTDKTNASHDYTDSILCFGIGAIGAMITYVSGYLAQLHYANHCLKVELKQPAEQEYEKHGRWQFAALTLVALTLGVALLGIWFAFQASRH